MSTPRDSLPPHLWILATALGLVAALALLRIVTWLWGALRLLE